MIDADNGKKRVIYLVISERLIIFAAENPKIFEK